MVFRHFQLVVVVQVALVLVSCGVLAYLLMTTSYYATVVTVSAVLALQIAVLLRYVQKTNRDLSRFLIAIRHSDFSQSFTVGDLAGSFADLRQSFQQVLDRFRQTRSEKEEQARYLDTLVEHIPVALLALDDTGEVRLFNKAARRLFGVSRLRHLTDFSGFGTGFPEAVLALQSGQLRLLRVARENRLLQLNVAVTALRIGGKTRKLVSLQDIHGELEARELEAWRNLIRVLTHEIMNSVTPITSLAATAGDLLGEAGASVDPDTPEGERIEDARHAVDTIASRSSGLMRFVQDYRRLLRVPEPKIRIFPVSELFGRIETLMQEEVREAGITLQSAVTPASLELSADAELLEQVLINLVRNAVDAVAEVSDPTIELRGELSPEGQVLISVADNGHGMDQAVQDNIFVPFYTTKRHGTGVGLSLVRQIIRSHRGQVGVRSAPGAGTTFRISF